MILGIIPARYASTRFPGKPLIEIHGKSMIQRVYEQAKKSVQLNQVIVATDDQRILDHVIGFGGLAVLTSNNHTSGTDRCAEVSLKHQEFNLIVNIQGDEPFIDPEQIDELCQCFSNDKTQLATLVKKIADVEELQNPNTPKVIFNKNLEAIYFSRTPIPFIRGSAMHEWLKSHTYYKHIGIYGYRSHTLLEITQIPVSSLEKAESLEQLRWIENGYRIQLAITDKESQAIDTPEDLQKVLINIGKNL